MVELDGDDIRISSRGKIAERDIVQVCFFNFLKNKPQSALCASLVAEQARAEESLCFKADLCYSVWGFSAHFQCVRRPNSSCYSASQAGSGVLSSGGNGVLPHQP